MSMDRRRFLALIGCVAHARPFWPPAIRKDPTVLSRLLAFAERKNEGAERFLFRHTSMDHAPRGAATGGRCLPTVLRL